MKNFIKRQECPTCKTNFDQATIYKKNYNHRYISSYLKDMYAAQGFIDYNLIKHAIFELLECQNCSLIYQKYVPNDFLLHEIYEEWINPDIAKNNHKSNTNNVGIKNEINLVRSMFKKSEKLTFYDFGMGWAEFLISAKKQGIECYGSELSKDRIDYALQMGINVIEFERLSNFKFDYIHTEQVFEHLCDPSQILESLVSSLKSGGIIRISVPNGKNIKQALISERWDASLNKSSKYSLNPVSPLEHLNCFNFNAMMKFAEAHDLTRVRPSNLSYLKYSSYSLNPFKSIKNIFRPFLINYYNISPSLYFIKG